MQERRRDVVAIADASFRGVGWNHTMAGIIEQQPCQQIVRLATYDGAVGPLGEGFLSDRVKQRAIHDRRLLARQDLVLVFDLTDIEVITQQIVQRAMAEREGWRRSSLAHLVSRSPSFPLAHDPAQYSCFDGTQTR